MTYLTTLYPKPPYDFHLLLDILARYAHPSSDFTHAGAYWRVLQTDSGLGLLRVTAAGTVDSPALEVHLMKSVGTVDTDSELDTLRHILQIDADLTAFYALARQHETLWPIVEPLVGLPELLTASPFEALMQAIIEQQIAWKTAQRAQRWLVEWADNRLTCAGRDYFAFPTPAQIAAATVDDLKPLKITFKRMGLMITIAQQITAGQLDLEALRHQGPDSAYATLLAIKGIGHWTALVTLGRAFGYRQAVAHNDVALQAAVNRYFYGGTGRIPAETVSATFAPFGEQAGLAAHFTLLRWVLDEYPRVET